MLGPRFYGLGIDEIAQRLRALCRAKAEPSVHVAAVQARGKWIKGAIDPASRGRTQTDGRQLL
jgi:hypothetical protein